MSNLFLNFFLSPTEYDEAQQPVRKESSGEKKPDKNPHPKYKIVRRCSFLSLSGRPEIWHMER